MVRTKVKHKSIHIKMIPDFIVVQVLNVSDSLKWINKGKTRTFLWFFVGEGDATGAALG